MVMVEKTDMTAEMEKTDKTVQVGRLKTLPVSDGFHMPREVTWTAFMQTGKNICRESLNHTKEPL